MFYMFSGPDFLYADAFYSEGDDLCAERARAGRFGAGPDATCRICGLDALDDIERSMSSILSFSFFITKHMKTDLRAGEVSGTLPILYVFLARSGKTIRDVSPIALDDAGRRAFRERRCRQECHARACRSPSPAATASRGRCIISAPIFPTAASRTSGFLKFCATLAPGNSLIKSASYLLHAGNFTIVRDFLLTNSATIIQDDSGIPLADYDPRKWRFFPFGRYAGPIDKFPGRYQPDYAELFRRSQPMDFGIGYRWRSFESNLLLSVRLPSDGTGHVDATSSAPIGRSRSLRAPAQRSALTGSKVCAQRARFFSEPMIGRVRALRCLSVTSERFGLGR